MLSFRKIDSCLLPSEFLKLNDCFLRTVAFFSNISVSVLRETFEMNSDINFNVINRVFNNRSALIYEGTRDNFQLVRSFDFSKNNAKFMVSVFPSKSQYEILKSNSSSLNDEFNQIWNLNYKDFLDMIFNDQANMTAFHWIPVIKNLYYDYYDYFEFDLDINDWIVRYVYEISC